ncbi:uncharacterized protein LOC122375748 [Amphibalanus amphitrite]|nr:uncharacterized protein LOC122369723 [Amphibalanus amphitrite]XP_043211177.1 uncharacterized protein LOC122375748 [Amphibalanus amphitrite]
MKLLLIACVCALAAAEQPQQTVPTAAQLTVGLTHLYRRFLHAVAPRQLELQDALDIQWRNGMMAGPPFRSPVQATFGGVEAPTFSFVNSMITPGQKGFFGKWSKHDTSDLLMTYNRGSLTKIHMLTDGGIHKEVVLGNPLHKHGAKFAVMIPKGTYCIFESLSEDDAAFVTYVAIPAWNPANSHNYSQKEMEAKFPDFSNMFHELSKPGVHEHEHGDEDYDHEHDEHDHDDHDEHDHGPQRRRLRRFRGRGRRFGGRH